MAAGQEQPKPMEIYYVMPINWLLQKSRTLIGHSPHLGLAIKSQMNLWAVLSAGPCINHGCTEQTWM